MTTAIRKQYEDLKQKHPDALLLFRCGDFYETYEDDAVKTADTLGITLTICSKDKSKLAGFPHHALDTYLPKLVRAGFRVAICDQLEDPRLTKKLVKRGVSELMKPNTAPAEETAPAPKKRAKREPKVKLPSITRQQYELLCECIRYRCADNDRERAEAERHHQFTAWYDDMASKLADLKDVIYNLK